MTTAKAKLSEAIVDQIWKLHNDKMKQQDIADTLGISVAIVSKKLKMT